MSYLTNSMEGPRQMRMIVGKFGDQPRSMRPSLIPAMTAKADFHLGERNCWRCGIMLSSNLQPLLDGRNRPLIKQVIETGFDYFEDQRRQAAPIGELQGFTPATLRKFPFTD